MPYYLLFTPSGNNFYQIYAGSPEQARMTASSRLQVPVSQITVRDSGASPFTNEYVPGTGPGPGGIATTGTGGVGSTGGIASTGAGVGSTIGGSSDEANKQAFESEYRAGLNRAHMGGGANPFSGYLRAQGEPAFDVFDIRSALGQEQADSPYDYVQNLFSKGMGAGGSITSMANDAWQEMLRQRAAGQGPATNPFIDPEGTLEAGQATELGNVANRAARTKYGTWGASWLPNANEQYQRYLAQVTGAAGGQPNIIDFYNRRIFGR